MNGHWLEIAVTQGALRPFDRHFALLMGELGGGDPGLMLAAALLTKATGEGHVCLPLAPIAGQRPFPEGNLDLTAPSLSRWRAILSASPVVGGPGAFTPLILDSAGRLYLGRYWHYENDLAEAILARAGETEEEPASSGALLGYGAHPASQSTSTDVFARLGSGFLLRPTSCIHAVVTQPTGLDRFFPGTSEFDWQKAAVALALSRRFSVISGGPGTGKTWTAVGTAPAHGHGRPHRQGGGAAGGIDPRGQGRPAPG